MLVIQDVGALDNVSLNVYKKKIKKKQILLHIEG